MCRSFMFILFIYLFNFNVIAVNQECGDNELMNCLICAIYTGWTKKVTPYYVLLIFWPKVQIFKIKFQSFEGNLYVRITTKFY